MTNVPDHLKYTPEHEWVEIVDESTIRFGITDYAQDSLGDIVFVSLPQLGASVSSGVSCGEVESTKSVSDIYAPVSGTVSARNDRVETAPEILNSDPYGEGWIATVSVDAPASEMLSNLLDAQAYMALVSA